MGPALYAFLTGKHWRSGSLHTVQEYSGMLRHRFSSLGKTPDRVTGQEIFVWGMGMGCLARNRSARPSAPALPASRRSTAF